MDRRPNTTIHALKKSYKKVNRESRESLTGKPAEKDLGAELPARDILQPDAEPGIPEPRIPKSDGMESPTNIFCMNVRGLIPSNNPTKISYLYDVAKLNNVAWICLTETHLKKNIDDSELINDDWSIVRADRTKRWRCCHIT